MKEASGDKIVTLTSLYGTERTKARNARSATAMLRLRQAYIAFFEGRPSVDDCHLIKVDLAKITGYYNTTPPDAPDTVLRYNEGQRSVFGHMAQLGNPAPSLMTELERAVQEEMKTDTQLGEIS